MATTPKPPPQPSGRTQRARAKANGIRIPWRAWKAAKKAGLPYWTLCAFLMKETGGGRNIYGHDARGTNGQIPQPFWGFGLVTQTNYACYRRERDALVDTRQFKSTGHRCQGVGPLQLTHWSIQDAADKAGGCWDIYTNLLVGARWLVKLRKEHPDSWHDVAKRWNGSEAYADSMHDLFVAWRRLLTGGN